MRPLCSPKDGSRIIPSPTRSKLSKAAARAAAEAEYAWTSAVIGKPDTLAASEKRDREEAKALRKHQRWLNTPAGKAHTASMAEYEERWE
jgi:hypothetical protein